MKLALAFALAALPLLLTACATSDPPEVFHNSDPSALVVQTFDNQTARQVMPTPTDDMTYSKILNLAQNQSQHQTAVIILENYSELKPGPVFRDRSLGWFIGLRGLGYQHIFILRGNGSSNPDGLVALAEYN